MFTLKTTTPPNCTQRSSHSINFCLARATSRQNTGTHSKTSIGGTPKFLNHPKLFCKICACTAKQFVQRNFHFAQHTTPLSLNFEKLIPNCGNQMKKLLRKCRSHKSKIVRLQKISRRKTITICTKRMNRKPPSRHQNSFLYCIVRSCYQCRRRTRQSNPHSSCCGCEKAFPLLHPLICSSRHDKNPCLSATSSPKNNFLAGSGPNEFVRKCIPIGILRETPKLLSKIFRIRKCTIDRSKPHIGDGVKRSQRFQDLFSNRC